MPPLGEYPVVVAGAEDGDAAGDFLLFDAVAHFGDDVVNAFHVADGRRVERRVSPQHAVIADVRVAVDEAGRHRPSLEVHDFGRRAFIAHHVVARADSENLPVFDCDRFGGRLRVIDGDDHAVCVYGVRYRRFCRIFRSRVVHNSSSISQSHIFLSAKRGTGKCETEKYPPHEPAFPATALTTCSLMASRLNEAGFCIGGNWTKVSPNFATSCWTKTKRQNWYLNH